MSKNAPSSIKQIVNSFDNFIKILEDPNWARTAKTDDIKTAFKLANYIEKTMEHFVSNGSVSEYMHILEKCWDTSDQCMVYKEDYFRTACDKLLTRFFQTENVSDNSLDISVRVYTSIFPVERLEKVISNVISLKCSYQAISDFINSHSNKGDVCNVEYQLKLQNWTFLVKTSRIDIVNDDISEMLSLYKVEKSLYLLIGILSLVTVDPAEKQTQSIVLKCITNKMLERSILSKPFWLTLFKRIHMSCISKACINFDRFFDFLINFIIYCGSMMKNENGLWVSDPVISVCPEIEYHDLFVLVRNLVKVSSEIKISVTDKLRQAKDDTGSDIWEKMLLDLK